MTPSADLIITNARILTMNLSAPNAEALAISDGRITAVGSKEEIRTLIRPGARIIDLKARMIVPGFNDCHMHILPYGLDLEQADLSPQAGVIDVPTLIQALRKWAEQNPRAEWILGSRYDQNCFPGARHPTRQDLDTSFPEKPVYLRQTSRHGGAANSVALKLAGITRETESAKGGEIVRDESGEPTGVLLENAEDLIKSLIPKPNESEMRSAIVRANRELVRKGITSASDLNTGWLDYESEMIVYRRAVEEGPPIRTTLSIHATAFGQPEQIPARIAFDRSWHRFQKFSSLDHGPIRLGPLKLFSDGALTVRTAALREPYVDGSGTGMLLHTETELAEYIWHANHNGWDVATHAIGDRAIQIVLECVADAQGANPRANSRHRIEHAMLLDEGLIRRIRKQRVIPVIQPEFISRLGDAYAMGLGIERASRLNPVASLMRAGIGVPFSSDCPIVPGAPLDGIRAACRRITPSGQVLGESERIGPLDALRNYTYWAAYASFDESETGTIEAGKRADLTILSGEPRDLDSLQVDATFVAGECVYGAERLN